LNHLPAIIWLSSKFTENLPGTNSLGLGKGLSNP